LLDQGFAQLTTPDSFVMTLDWTDEVEYLGRMSKKSRQHMRREVLPWREAYDVEVLNAQSSRPTQPELDAFYGLYRQVKSRAFEINTFELPETFFARLLEASGWELLVLRLRPEYGGDPAGRPVALVASYRGLDQYVPLVAGLDYQYLSSHGAYRALVWQIIERARHLGVRRIAFGMGAPLEKSRVGARPQQHHCYLQTADLFRLEQLGQLLLDAQGGRA
jgi:CelD/BcsL family acetyltransferase involved in cellulose biosynthesis